MLTCDGLKMADPSRFGFCDAFGVSASGDCPRISVSTDPRKLFLVSIDNLESLIAAVVVVELASCNFNATRLS